MCAKTKYNSGLGLPVKSRELLVKDYLTIAWVLKIRLISARLQLWHDLTSVIHIEFALLQMRKICEAITRLCLIAGNIDGLAVSKQDYNEFAVGKVLKKVIDRGSKHFPRSARLHGPDTTDGMGRWELNMTADLDPAEPKRIIKIWNECGKFLHDPMLYKVINEISFEAVASNLNAIRGDNQWIWNRFWHHSVLIENTWFFINLGDVGNSSQPMIISESGFLGEMKPLEMDPKLIADFNEPIDWKYHGHISTQQNS